MDNDKIDEKLLKEFEKGIAETCERADLDRPIKEEIIPLDKNNNGGC
jgi:hypothetical protein